MSVEGCQRVKIRLQLNSCSYDCSTILYHKSSIALQKVQISNTLCSNGPLEVAKLKRSPQERLTKLCSDSLSALFYKIQIKLQEE